MEPESSTLQCIIEGGIKAPIRLLLEHGHFAAALVLTYSGIDTMSFLNMASERTDVMRSDFIAWCDKYVVPALGHGITGRDLYAARCSVLHGGAHSRLARGGECRPIKHLIEVWEPGDHTVTVHGFIDAVLTGMNQFAGECEANTERHQIVAARVAHLVQAMPYSCD
jgi:hypothetical protein